MSDDAGNLALPNSLAEELKALCVESLPRQKYGLVGGRDVYHPESLYPCSTNLRSTPEWKSLFDSFGEFYREPDRGFVIAPEEHFEILRRMRSRNETLVGVFHSHRSHGPSPTEADVRLHVDPDVFAYIVSVVTPHRPELEIFRISGSGFERIPFRIL